MTTLTPLFQAFVFGDRSAFAFIPNHQSMETVCKSETASAFILGALKNGYAFTNADRLYTLSEEDLERLDAEFTKVVAGVTKEGFILRKTFGEAEVLTEYTDEEWAAIIAQYSITYGWANAYENRFGSDPVQILDDYLGSLPTEVTDVSKQGTKLITLWGPEETRGMVLYILESKSVLRNHQKKILENAPAEFVSTAMTQARIPIKETLIWAANLVVGEILILPIFRSSTDVLRFVVTHYVEAPITDQLSKNALRPMKMYIPTRVRKFLLHNLELIGEHKGAKYLCEDMFIFSDFWKRLDKYLRFTKMTKMHERYPEYGKAIDLLYEDDRSWTFNGRYSAAKAIMDYDMAFVVASERPGFLLRNLLEFMRMAKGTKIPKKLDIGRMQHRTRRDPMQEMFEPKVPKEKKVGGIVQCDAFDLLMSAKFRELLLNSANPKLLWQTVELLSAKEVYLPYTSRTVQGVEVHYDGPMPGVDNVVGKHVLLTCKNVLREKLNERNAKLGKVYLDDDIEGFKIQYSGRKETGINMSGQALVSGTELSIADLLGSSEHKNPIIRLGVMWRGREGGPSSVDLDHSLNVFGHQPVYYGRTAMHDNRGGVCITSSGDLTSCGGHTSIFSTEFVDIDVNKCRESKIMEMVSSVIVYSGRSTLSQYECYFFVNVIDASQRQIGNHLTIDLQHTDYAVAIDPEGIDKTGGQLGLFISLEKGTLEVLNLPLNSDGCGSNVVNNRAGIEKLLKSRPKRLNLLDVLGVAVSSSQLVYDAENADTIVSQGDFSDLANEAVILHPGRDGEQIQRMLF